MNNKLNYYQYQPPIAMFSMADFDSSIAVFGIMNVIKAPFKKLGEYMVSDIRSKAGGLVDDYVKKNADEFKQFYPDGVPSGARERLIDDALRNDRLYNWMKNHPARAGLAFGGVPFAAAVGGTTFLRRRRTKKGKIVVEQVRKKA